MLETMATSLWVAGTTRAQSGCSLTPHGEIGSLMRGIHISLVLDASGRTYTVIDTFPIESLQDSKLQIRYATRKIDDASYRSAYLHCMARYCDMTSYRLSAHLVCR